MAQLNFNSLFLSYFFFIKKEYHIYLQTCTLWDILYSTPKENKINVMGKSQVSHITIKRCRSLFEKSNDKGDVHIFLCLYIFIYFLHIYSPLYIYFFFRDIWDGRGMHFQHFRTLRTYFRLNVALTKTPQRNGERERGEDTSRSTAEKNRERGSGEKKEAEEINVH